MNFQSSAEKEYGLLRLYAAKLSFLPAPSRKIADGCRFRHQNFFNSKDMRLIYDDQIGAVAPDFEADTTEGASISMTGWKQLGNAVLPPKDFTRFAHRTGTTARLKPEFDKRGVKLIAQRRPVDRHAKWGETSRKLRLCAELPDDRRHRAQGRGFTTSARRHLRRRRQPYRRR